MKKVIESILKNSGIVVFISILIMLLGIYNFSIIPKFENPKVEVGGSIITIVYPGASPKEVEEFVTKVVEESVSKIPGIDYIKSNSIQNASIMMVILDESVDFYVTNQKIRQKIEDIKAELPEEVLEPEIVSDELSDIVGMMVTLSGENYDYEELSIFAEEIKSELSSISGINKTEIIGKVEKEVIVEVTMALLNKQKLSINDLQDILIAQNIEIPNGAVKNESSKIYVKTPASYKSLKDIRGIIIARSSKTGAVVKLSDVATVSMKLKENAVKLKQDNNNAIMVGVYFSDDRDMIKTGKDIRARINKLEANLPPDLTFKEIIFRPDDVAYSINNFLGSLFTGMILVIGVMYFAMGARNAFVVGLCLPFSILGTFIIMKMGSINIQSMSLMGFIISLGMIVDNSIVICDGINVKYNNGMNKTKAVVETVYESATPIFTSTLTTIAAFMPLILIKGSTGDFLSSMPTVVIITLIFSFIVAMFIVPSLFTVFIKGSVVEKVEIKKDNKFKRLYISILEKALHHKMKTLLIAAICFSITIGLIVPMLKVSFFPTYDKDIFYIDMYTEKIGDLNHTEKISDGIAKILNDVPEITDVTAGIGTSMPRFYMSILPVADQENYSRLIVKYKLENTDRFDDRKEFNVFIQKILDESVAGAKAKSVVLELTDPKAVGVEIRLFGDNIDELRHAGEEVAEHLRSIPGTANVESDIAEFTFQYIIDVDQDIASTLGVLNSDIQKQVNNALYGTVKTSLRVDIKKFDIKVKSDIRSLEELGNMEIKSSITGEKILLKRMATIKIEPSLDGINRYNEKRSVFITSGVRPGYDAIEVSNIFEKKYLNKLNLGNIELVMEGERETIARTFGDVAILGVFILLLMYLILLIQFKSFVEPFIILGTIPLSVIGSMIALFVTGRPLSFTSFIGLISLMGVVVNNGILLVEYIKKARKDGKSIYEACICAVDLRFRPIMLSTTTTLIGLIPLAMSSNELFSPMAITLIGGLLTSTALTIIIIPVSYSVIDIAKCKMLQYKSNEIDDKKIIEVVYKI